MSSAPISAMVSAARSPVPLMDTMVSFALTPALSQGLTLVHFSAQPEQFLTQNTP